MNRILTLMAAILLTASLAQAKMTTYGNGVHLQEITKISDLLATPENYIGKRVKVEGMVLEVCAKRGCWIYLASDRLYEKIQIKVTDGVIVFPMSASGKQARVEGVVEELKMSKDDLIKYKKHLAEEQGRSFDPASIREGEKIIRIIGLGAEIDS